jgi:hypothetical protein
MWEARRSGRYSLESRCQGTVPIFSVPIFSGGVPGDSPYFLHGGASAELKERAVHEILRTAQQLLSEAAFLRKPPYPGVSCRYRGQCGFTAVIRGSLYAQGKRAREEFRVMKYFHLGHRLEGIVEQELATHAKQQELDQ